MFQNITYKKKFYVVILGFAILFLASYKKTFKYTLKAKQQLAEVEEKLTNKDHSYHELYNLKNSISNLNTLIGGRSLNPVLVQQNILDFVSRTDFEVNVVSIEDVHVYHDQDFLIYTNQIELEGAYENLIKLLYEVEKHFKDSRVASSKFYSKKNYGTNTKKLYLKITLQNYEKA